MKFLTLTAVLAAALFSMVVTLPFAPAARMQPDVFVLEARARSSVDGALQVYYDDGKGWREELSGRATVTVAVGGTGAGAVGSTPTGITCSATAGSSSGSCSAQFETGTTVSLSATPAAGSLFTGWSGACGGTGACQLTVAENATVTAT